MKLAVFGSGYVGLVTAACFAQTGNQVTCIDINPDRITNLKKGIIPIYEPGLENLIIQHAKNHNIQFTTDATSVIKNADIIFIAVGTPSKPDGSANLDAVFNVVEKIKTDANPNAIIIIKSTVPIGTTDSVQTVLSQEVVFNPEFLKQGSAVADAMQPDRIIVGTQNIKTIDTLKKLYQPYFSDEKKFLVMDTRSAEMTKYVANAMLATKISFINEMSQIADRVGADIYQVRDGIALDERIGPHFINPGLGYGGSCFPKDVKALQKTAESVGYQPRILKAIEDVNQDQKLFLFDKIMRFYRNDIRGKKFAIWGLAFKPNTDDLRDAASITLIKKLWEQGATIQAYDPKAMHNFQKQFDIETGYSLHDSATAALSNTDALCILTEWDEFQSTDLIIVQSSLRDKVIFDGRKVLNKQVCKQQGLNYIGI